MLPQRNRQHFKTEDEVLTFFEPVDKPEYYLSYR